MASIFDTIPEELINIIVSYLKMDDILKLKIITRIQELFNKQSFWIGQLTISQSEEYSIYRKLTEIKDYQQVYMNILDIRDFIDYFTKTYYQIKLILYSIDAKIDELIDPTDISYFRFNINIDSSKKDNYFTPWDVPMMTIENKQGTGKFICNTKDYFSRGGELKIIDRMELIGVLTKCKILELDIWNPPISELGKSLENWLKNK